MGKNQSAQKQQQKKGEGMLHNNIHHLPNNNIQHHHIAVGGLGSGEHHHAAVRGGGGTIASAAAPEKIIVGSGANKDTDVVVTEHAETNVALTASFPDGEQGRRKEKITLEEKNSNIHKITPKQYWNEEDKDQSKKNDNLNKRKVHLKTSVRRDNEEGQKALFEKWKPPLKAKKSPPILAAGLVEKQKVAEQQGDNYNERRHQQPQQQKNNDKPSYNRLLSFWNNILFTADNSELGKGGAGIENGDGFGNNGNGNGPIMLNQSNYLRIMISIILSTFAMAGFVVIILLLFAGHDKQHQDYYYNDDDDDRSTSLKSKRNKRRGTKNKPAKRVPSTSNSVSKRKEFSSRRGKKKKEDDYFYESSDWEVEDEEQDEARNTAAVANHRKQFQNNLTDDLFLNHDPFSYNDVMQHQNHRFNQHLSLPLFPNNNSINHNSKRTNFENIDDSNDTLSTSSSTARKNIDGTAATADGNDIGSGVTDLPSQKNRLVQRHKSVGTEQHYSLQQQQHQHQQLNYYNYYNQATVKAKAGITSDNVSSPPLSPINIRKKIQYHQSYSSPSHEMLGHVATAAATVETSSLDDNTTASVIKNEAAATNNSTSSTMTTSAVTLSTTATTTTDDYGFIDTTVDEKDHCPTASVTATITSSSSRHQHRSKVAASAAANVDKFFTAAGLQGFLDTNINSTAATTCSKDQSQRNSGHNNNHVITSSSSSSPMMMMSHMDIINSATAAAATKTSNINQVNPVLYQKELNDRANNDAVMSVEEMVRSNSNKMNTFENQNNICKLNTKSSSKLMSIPSSHEIVESTTTIASDYPQSISLTASSSNRTQYNKQQYLQPSLNALSLSAHNSNTKNITDASTAAEAVQMQQPPPPPQSITSDLTTSTGVSFFSTHSSRLQQQQQIGNNANSSVMSTPSRKSNSSTSCSISTRKQRGSSSIKKPLFDSSSLTSTPRHHCGIKVFSRRGGSSNNSHHSTNWDNSSISSMGSFHSNRKKNRAGVVGSITTNTSSNSSSGISRIRNHAAAHSFEDKGITTAARGSMGSSSSATAATPATIGARENHNCSSHDALDALLDSYAAVSTATKAAASAVAVPLNHKNNAGTSLDENESRSFQRGSNDFSYRHDHHNMQTQAEQLISSQMMPRSFAAELPLAIPPPPQDQQVVRKQPQQREHQQRAWPLQKGLSQLEEQQQQRHRQPQPWNMNNDSSTTTASNERGRSQLPISHQQCSSEDDGEERLLTPRIHHHDSKGTTAVVVLDQNDLSVPWMLPLDVEGAKKQNTIIATPINIGCRGAATTTKTSKVNYKADTAVPASTITSRPNTKKGQQFNEKKHLQQQTINNEMTTNDKQQQQQQYRGILASNPKHPQQQHYPLSLETKKPANQNDVFNVKELAAASVAFTESSLSSAAALLMKKNQLASTITAQTEEEITSNENNNNSNKNQKVKNNAHSITNSNSSNQNIGIQHKRKDPSVEASDSYASLDPLSIKFSDLTLINIIGGGGFGQVWHATWHGTPVAVKLLSIGGAPVASIDIKGKSNLIAKLPQFKVPKKVLDEFAAEINLLSGMRHPNICLYLGACLDPPHRAIVTELAVHGSLWDALRMDLSAPFVCSDGTKGGSLWPDSLFGDTTTTTINNSSERIKRKGNPGTATPPAGTWPWCLVKKVAAGAARGMTYLHNGSPPVLHRDLKSANLLLDDSYTVKVADFGLSRLKAQERSMTGNCGTVQWMAPEVLANQSYAEPADVYSYGIILIELLTQECPFDGMSPIQCALAVLNKGLRPDIPPWCPPSLEALIISCIAQSAESRPTFSQILSALDTMS